MATAESYFTGSRMIKLIPCTSSGGRLCHIFREISHWNEYFWPVGLELRELSPGRLSVVERGDAYVGVHADQGMPEEINVVALLLHHLLTNHQCVSSVVIVSSILRDNHQLMCDALSKSLRLQKLKLYALRTTINSPWNIVTALLHLKDLRELELQNIPFERSFIEGLSEFLTSTRLLTTLTVTHEYLEHEGYAIAFLEGLRRNQTITKLSLDVTLLGCIPHGLLLEMTVSPWSAVMFADYLRTNKTLRTLTLKSSDCLQRFTEVSRPIVEALVRNDTLKELNLESLFLENKDIELITWLISQNRTLASFNMIRCESSDAFGRANFNPAALAENTTLEDLTLELPCFNATECQSLFKGLAAIQSLKKVTVKHFIDFDVAEICRAVRESGAGERFFVRKHNVRENTVGVLTECKELSSVAVYSGFFVRQELLLTTLSVLSSCSHVTSLFLKLSEDAVSGRVISLLAQCIIGMATLRKLELSTGTEICAEQALKQARRELAQALSVNKSIRSLRVEGPWFGETEIEMLADTLQSSRTLCELSFFPYYHDFVTCLLRSLSTNISSNFTLLGMQLERRWRLSVDGFTVADVIRRNCSLVMRAAHFVMGTRNRHCAAAAELLHWNPGLVEKVQELASVDENEAASLIQRSLKSYSELDEFMRVAGVVKYGVTCHSRDDGKKQLADIGRDCWLYLRQYVKVGDILDEQ